MARRATIGIALLALAGTAGCRTSLVRRGLERRLERRLPDLLGPADSYSVKIPNSPDAELVQGRARRVDIRGSHVYAKNRFMIDSLRLTLLDLRYEGGEPYFVSVGRSDLEVEITDAALNDYLKSRNTRYDPQIRFEPDRVEVSMVYRLLGTPTPIQASGHLEIEDGHRLMFRAEKVSVSLLNRPGFGQKFLEDRVNPLLDLGKIEFPAQLDGVQVVKGRLKAIGAATIPHEGHD